MGRKIIVNTESNKIALFLLDIFNPEHLFSDDFNLESYLQYTIKSLSNFFNYKLVILRGIDINNPNYLKIYATNILDKNLSQQLTESVNKNQGVSLHLFQTKKPYYSKDLFKDEIYRQKDFARSAQTESGEKLELKSAAFFPIMTNINQELWGFLVCYKEEINGFGENPHQLEENKLSWYIVNKILEKVIFYAYNFSLKNEEILNETKYSSRSMSFLLGTLHDVKSKLNGLFSQADFLSNNMNKIIERFSNENNKILIEYLSKIINEANEIKELTYRLDEEKKIEDKVFISNVLKSIKDSIHPILIKTREMSPKINIEFSCKPEKIGIYGFKKQLNQLFFNFVYNSFEALIKKNENKNKRIKISIELFKEQKRVYFEIYDNGIGINKDVLLGGKLFKRGITTKRDIGGTGLGLFLCNQIIKLHDGAIVSVSSKNYIWDGSKVSPNKNIEGAIFKFWLSIN